MADPVTADGEVSTGHLQIEELRLRSCRCSTKNLPRVRVATTATTTPPTVVTHARTRARPQRRRAARRRPRRDRRAASPRMIRHAAQATRRSGPAGSAPRCSVAQNPAVATAGQECPNSTLAPLSGGAVERLRRRSVQGANAAVGLESWEAEPVAMPVASARLDGNELVLSVPGRDEDEATHRSVTGVPHGVGHPPRHEDKASRGDRELAVSEPERGVAVGDVERLVGVRVDMQRRRRLTRRKRADDDDIRAVRLGRAEVHRLPRFGGTDNGAPIDRFHRR